MIASAPTNRQDTAVALDADWLGACRRAAESIHDILHDGGDPTRVTGTRGEGGDETLVIDAEAESAVFRELEALHDDGARFTAVSEERGEVDFGSSDVIVIIDPIDGSTNAKRGLPHHSMSIAVADGPTMGDVAFGYVYDYGPEEEWSARRGDGAWLDGVRLERDIPERISDDRLELLGIESADPKWIRDVADDLVAEAHRIRALGTIAVTLCQVAAARLDAMVTLRRSRAVDAAAGQLIVREAGGAVAFTAYDDPLGAPLDTQPRSPLVAARTPAGLERVRRIPRA
jgi:myo-inositol-1(or 4)-monophosphatase